MHVRTLLEADERVQYGQLQQRLRSTTVLGHVVHDGKHLLDRLRRAEAIVRQQLTVLTHHLVGGETEIRDTAMVRQIAFFLNEISVTL